MITLAALNLQSRNGKVLLLLRQPTRGLWKVRQEEEYHDGGENRGYPLQYEEPAPR